MQTRSSSKFVSEPSTNPASTIPKHRNRRRSIQRVKPFSFVETLVVTMVDQRTMAELLRAPTEGYAEAIVVPPIPAEHFELKHSLINLYKDVPETSIKLMLFPFSIDGSARIWLDKEPPQSILTWDDLFEETFSEAWDRFKDLLRACPRHGFTKLHQLDTFYNCLNPSYQDSLNSAAGGNLLERSTQDVLNIIEKKSKVRNSRNKRIVSQVKASNVDSSEIASAVANAMTSAMTAIAHSYRQCPATDGNTFSGYHDNIQGYVSAVAANDAVMKNMQTQMTSLTNSNIELKNMFGQFMKMNTASTSGSGSLPSNTIANPRGDLKAITTQSGISYDGPLILPPYSSLPKVVEREPELVVAPKPKSSIPYPSRANKQKLREKDDNLALKFVEIFRELHFKLSFADALLHMSKFASMFKSILNNKEKLFDLAKTPVNENCSAVFLKKLPEKLGDPGKFLIPCDFPELVECLALADLGARNNSMPLSIWKKLSLPELTPTQMILELVDRSTTSLFGIAKDIFVKVVKFHFLADFVVVDYVVDPRVPLILGRPFLRTARALIDVYSEELTLRVDDEAITFKVGQTSRYSYNDALSINQIDIIDVAYEEYAQEVLGFSDSSTSDFVLEEIEAYLTNDSILPGIDDDDFDPKGDLLLLKKLLNNDPSSPLPPKELHVEELTIVKSSIDDPLEHELKDLPSHLEYEFLEVTDKLPVIIAKDIKEDEKVRLLKVLKSHKRAIAWKILNIKGIDPQFCTHKILMEDDSKPEIQHQRRLNDATRKDHFPLPFMDQMLDRLAGNEYYYFRDGFSGYFQIPIDPKDQEKTTFTCPYGTFAYRRMPFGLCNASGTFQRCMMAIFHDMIEETMEVFMDDFLVFGDSFSSCLSHLDKMLKRCEDTNLVLNWKKCHFMVKECIVLGHKISKSGIEVKKAKFDVIAKLPHPTSVKGIRSFLGHAGFYNRFIQDFSKIARPMTQLLEKDTPFIFLKKCIESFNILKKKLTEAPILVAPDWDLPFGIMCDASDYVVGAVLGQCKTKYFQPIHYASKTMTDAQANYTTTKKKLLAVVYAFEKLWPYLVLSKTIVYTDHSALKYLLAKQDAKPILLRWILLLQEIDVIIHDKKGAKNLAADHLSRLENPHQDVLENKEITKTFPLKTLGDVFPAKNSLISSRLAIMDPPGDIMVPTTPLKKSLILDFIGRLFTEIPMTWSHGVTLVNVKAKSRKKIKCPKMQYKFARSLACGASISWARSRLHEGTSIYSWPSTTFLNGLKQKRSPPMTPKIAPDYEDSRAHGFVLRSLELQSLA
ncbi:reverse transcriptase domain-containing protein [Tanacetum coccineum]